MSKNVAMFVDVANMYYAARGQDVDVDYVALLKHATKGRDLIRAYAYTGLDPENENQRKFIDFLGKNGYKPVVKDIRKFGDGRMKANLDIELVVDLFRLADRMDIAVIVSGSTPPRKGSIGTLLPAAVTSTTVASFAEQPNSFPSLGRHSPRWRGIRCSRHSLLVPGQPSSMLRVGPGG